jgi:deazaflavin-dependent oxidoreductase (nitroreductase family)
MTAVREQAPRTPPRPFIRIIWMLHRTAYRVTGGRFGLSRPVADGKFGMLRLATVGRKSGQPRIAIIGYFEDGPNLVTLAMNGWGRSEPAWWLNLQAQLDTTVGLADGHRAVRARAATGAERDLLWAKFGEFPGWGEDIDGLAARRPSATAVVVLEPRSGDDVKETDNDRTLAESRADELPIARSQQRVDAGRRLRIRHLWIVPGLAMAIFANGQANQLGVGIGALVLFGLAPDLTRLLGIGKSHAHSHMAARAIPAFNLMHHPLSPILLLALTGAGLLPPIAYVASLTWLGHIVIGFGIGDRLRRRDGSLAPIWLIGGLTGGATDAAGHGASTSAELLA